MLRQIFKSSEIKNLRHLNEQQKRSHQSDVQKLKKEIQLLREIIEQNTDLSPAEIEELLSEKQTR
ncbi:MAG: hypothetical protein AAF226_14550 [Verrucomicrobiota bacterium]